MWSTPLLGGVVNIVQIIKKAQSEEYKLERHYAVNR